MRLLRPACLLATVAAAAACRDNDARIAEAAAARGETSVSGCVDVVDLCNAPGTAGDFIRKTCCEMCEGATPPSEGREGFLDPGVMNLPDAGDGDGEGPLQLFLLGGQSECVGQASVSLLKRKSASDYPDLVGLQPGVWFAGKHGSTFNIQPMEAGTISQTFGPELSFGKRVHDIIGGRIAVVKYCWGGSNVATHWNPTTPSNSWNYTADNGTAAWLEANAGVDMHNTDALFVNFIYVARLATEALAQAGLAHEWKGMAWVQGAGDKSYSYDVFGSNTAQLFDAVRARLNALELPIVDTGANVNHQLSSGKARAQQLTEACNVAWVEFNMAAQKADSDCQVSATDPCRGNNFVNYDLFNFFGWDPNTPDSDKPPGATDRVFHWFKEYPNNLHSEYEGMIILGRMLANEYVRSFSDAELPLDFVVSDPSLLFPWKPCAHGTEPSADNLCWIDQRDEVNVRCALDFGDDLPDCTSKSMKKGQGKKCKETYGCSYTGRRCTFDPRGVAKIVDNADSATSGRRSKKLKKTLATACKSFTKKKDCKAAGSACKFTKRKKRCIAQ